MGYNKLQITLFDLFLNYVIRILMDYYETQKKYRKKSFKVFANIFLKIILVAFSILIGWRIGASDKEILLLENEKKLECVYNKYDKDNNYCYVCNNLLLQGDDGFMICSHPKCSIIHKNNSIIYFIIIIV